MPRENRKRGKKNKKKPEEEFFSEPQKVIPAPESDLTGEPSWIRPAAEHIPETNPEAPFGYVDTDVKAYFRTVDVQIRDWQGAHEETGVDEDVDPNERE
jgi:nucleolar protein 9